MRYIVVLALGFISIKALTQVNDFLIFPNAFSQYNPYFETISDIKINSNNKIKTWTKFYQDSTSLKPLFKYTYDLSSRILKYELFNDSGNIDYSYENYFYKDSIIKKYFNKVYFLEKYLINSSGSPTLRSISDQKSIYYYDANGLLVRIINYKQGKSLDTVFYKIVKIKDTVSISHNNEIEIFNTKGDPLEYQFLDKRNQVQSRLEFYYDRCSLKNKISSRINPKEIESNVSYFYDRWNRLVKTIDVGIILEIRKYKYNEKNDIEEEAICQDYLGIDPKKWICINKYEYY